MQRLLVLEWGATAKLNARLPPHPLPCAGMCRAHGIPHQRVVAASDLHAALRSAWGCNRHSVIEVVTSRASNVQRHREVQAEVKAAVERALALLQHQPAVDAAAGRAAAEAGTPEAAGPEGAAFELEVASASYHAYSLPLARPLTTAAGGDSSGMPERRSGFLLHMALAPSGPGGATAHGVGEVAPLPGLHAETLQQAEAQLALLCQLLSGSGSSVQVPLTVALLGGRLGAWLEQGLGVAPGSLLPSVRCGLETALLSALAQASAPGRNAWGVGLCSAGDCCRLPYRCFGVSAPC